MFMLCVINQSTPGKANLYYIRALTVSREKMLKTVHNFQHVNTLSFIWLKTHSSHHIILVVTTEIISCWFFKLGLMIQCSQMEGLCFH